MTNLRNGTNIGGACVSQIGAIPVNDNPEKAHANSAGNAGAKTPVTLTVVMQFTGAADRLAPHVRDRVSVDSAEAAGAVVKLKLRNGSHVFDAVAMLSSAGTAAAVVGQLYDAGPLMVMDAVFLMPEGGAPPSLRLELREVSGGYDHDRQPPAPPDVDAVVHPAEIAKVVAKMDKPPTTVARRQSKWTTLGEQVQCDKPAGHNEHHSATVIGRKPSRSSWTDADEDDALKPDASCVGPAAAHDAGCATRP